MVMSVRKADSPGAAVLLTVLGIVMGIVFTSNALFLITDVERSECAAVETRLLSNSRKQNTSSRTRIRLDCADGQRYFINASCATEALWESLCDLEPQTRINLLIHPHSRQTVVELDAGGSVTTRCANWKRKDKAFCSSVPLCTDAPSLAFACSSDMAYAGRTCAEAASRAGAETAPMRNRSDTHTLRALSKAGRKQNAFGGFDNDSYCVPFPCGTASAAGRFFRFSIDGRALFMLHLKKKAAIRQCSATAAHQNRGGPA